VAFPREHFFCAAHGPIGYRNNVNLLLRYNFPLYSVGSDSKPSFPLGGLWCYGPYNLVVFIIITRGWCNVYLTFS